MYTNQYSLILHAYIYVQYCKLNKWLYVLETCITTLLQMPVINADTMPAIAQGTVNDIGSSVTKDPSTDDKVSGGTQ